MHAAAVTFRRYGHSGKQTRLLASGAEITTVRGFAIPMYRSVWGR